MGLAGLTLAVIMYGIGEYAAPPLAQFAKREKTTDKLADVSFRGLEQCMGEGWKPHPAGSYRGGRSGIRRCVAVPAGWADAIALHPASRADFRRGSRRWSLHNVATSHFGDDHVSSDTVGEVTMRSTVNPDFLGLAATDPGLLTLRGLASYIDHLRRNSLDTASYEIGYWSRIARLFAVIVVTLLALPFVFGPLRTTGAGTRTVIGVMLGVVFFLITRTIENGGQLFGLNPARVGRLAADGSDRPVYLGGDIENALRADSPRGRHFETSTPREVNTPRGQHPERSTLRKACAGEATTREAPPERPDLAIGRALMRSCVGMRSSTLQVNSARFR